MQTCNSSYLGGRGGKLRGEGQPEQHTFSLSKNWANYINTGYKNFISFLSQHVNRKLNDIKKNSGAWIIS